MKLKARQVEFTASDVQSMLTLAGLNPTVVGQIIGFVQDMQLTLIEVDNSSNNGVMGIGDPKAGTVYRAMYPVPQIVLGHLEEGSTVWFEFCYGQSGSNGDIPFIHSSDQTIYWALTSSSVTPAVLTEGAYYQIEISNKFGRVYANIAKTQLLAPTPQPQAAEEDGEEVTPTPQSQEEVEPEEVEDPGDG